MHRSFLDSLTLSSSGGAHLEVLTWRLPQVTSLDFTPDGSQLLTASNDHGLRVYDCGDQGILKKTLFARKFGISLARFMHDPSTVSSGNMLR